MQSHGREQLHNGVLGSLWDRGERRGQYEAFRYDEHGKRTRHTLSTSSSQEADALIVQLNDELVAGGPATIEACFRLYKFRKEQKGKWDQSMERSRKVICAQIGDLLANQVTESMCEGMIEARLKAGMAPDTVRIEMAYLRASLKHAAKNKRITEAPFVLVPQGGEVREHWLKQDEIRRLIEGAAELHVKLFIILSVTTAGRPSHILGLKWERVDMDGLIVNFRDGTRNNKHKPRVPINATCLEHLTIAKELSRTEYVIEFRGRAHFHNAKKGVAEAARRAGLKGVSPYVLRHTAGVWMAKARVPMQEIMAYMGHKHMATTIKHYAHHHPDFLRDAASALEIGPK